MSDKKTDFDELAGEMLKGLENIKTWSAQLTRHEEVIGDLNDKILKLTGEMENHQAMPFEQNISPRKWQPLIQFRNKEEADGFVNTIKAILSGEEKNIKQMTEGTDSEGGYLVIPQYATTILRLVEVFGFVRPRATVVPMSVFKLYFPNLVSGITPYWVTEKGAITTSQPVFGQLELTVKKLCALVPTSSELVADASISIATLIATLVAEAFAKEEDRVALVGNTSASPADPFDGIIYDSNVTVYTMPSGSTAFTDLHPDDMLGMIGQLTEAGRMGAEFILEATVEHVLMKAKDTTNDYIYQRPTAKEPGVCWGYPVNKSAVMPSVSQSLTDSTIAADPFVILGNLKHFIIGDRQQLSIMRSPHYYFNVDVDAWRFIERVALAVGIPSAFAVCETSAT